MIKAPFSPVANIEEKAWGHGEVAWEEGLATLLTSKKIDEPNVLQSDLVEVITHRHHFILISATTTKHICKAHLNIMLAS